MERFAGALYLMGAFMLGGTSVIAGRYVSGLLGIFTIATVSLLFALAGLLPLCRGVLAKAVALLTRRDGVRFFLQALFGIFLFRIFVLQGLLRTSAGEAGIITGATPAATALLAWLALKEPLSGIRVLGVLCTIVGVSTLQGGFASSAAFAFDHFLGNLLILCAALSESLFNILSRAGYLRSLTQGAEIEPLVQTTFVVWIAFCLCLGPALAEQPWVALAAIDFSTWLALLWYGFFATAMAYYFWYAGIKRSDASTAAAFSGMMPITAMLLSVVFLNEQLGETQFLGGGMVVLGMLLASLDG